MIDAIFGAGPWLAGYFVAVLMFVVGARLGYRAGWEAGHLQGQRAADQRRASIRNRSRHVVRDRFRRPA